MRPQKLDDLVGQQHIIGPGRLLRRAIIADQLSSLIFYGPPGTGKTTLAKVIAKHTSGHFMSLNAVLSGVAQIRSCIAEAQERQRLTQTKSILFIDEVHRFNKGQQDALLPHVENGTIIFIGATTENPFFEVNKALVSRSRLFELCQLSDEDLSTLVDKAIFSSCGYGAHSVSLDQRARAHLIRMCNGDARTLLNALELAVEPELKRGNDKITIDLKIAEDSIQKRALLYDRDGDAHFDTISAFIKSLRGSDPDAALYWLAKMVHSGEDPRFIFRRMLISASEDVGLANPGCLSQVLACSQAFDIVGLPEGQFHLSQACIAISLSPKSNSTLGYFDALRSVSQVNAQSGDIPQHLKDASRDDKELGHGKGYRYPHAYREHWVAQQYLPDGLKGKVFFNPSDQGYERSIQDNVQARREASWAAIHDAKLHQLPLETEQRKDIHWENHDINSSQDLLLTLRDEIFRLAQPEGDELICDLYAGTGLITLEAARRTRSGGIYAITQKQQEFDTLKHLCSNLPKLSMPEIALSNSPITSDWKNSLVFDLIISKQLSSHAHIPIGKEGWRLSSKGRLLICEQDLMMEQRLWELISTGSESFSHDDLQAWKTIEEGFYREQAKASQQPTYEGLELVESSHKETTLNKRFREQDIKSWFSSPSPLYKWIDQQRDEMSKEVWAKKFNHHLSDTIQPWRRRYHFQLWKKSQ